DLATVLAVIVPGPIVGMLVVRLFQWPIPGFHAMYQQSLVPTLIALLVRAVPISYWIMRAGYRGIGAPVLEAARLDDSWWRRLWRVDSRVLMGSLLVAGLASAVVATGDVPVTLPVAPPGVTTVGTRLFGLLHSGARYQEAALAIWYLAAVVAISLFISQRSFDLHGKLK
ncbi:MAG: amino acid ABC transporter permease, partial [Rubripirellula sp.]